jgi:peptidoglycan hydrolase-like protein with peptidoglycan-binding domain
MTLAKFRNATGGDPVSPALRSAEPARAGRRTICSNAFVAAGVALLLAGCELPSSFEDLTKVFEGETQEDQVEKASVEQPQDDADAAAAQAGSTEQSDAAETGPTREMVLTAQTLLAGLGYDPGPLDGLAGPKTRDAVRKYQADADTPTDGRITEALLERLADSDGGKTGPDDGPDLASQALPVYAPGDTFIYSDGRTETVTDIDGDQVRWQSNDGTDVTAYRDFVLPAIRRETNLLNEQTTADAGPGAWHCLVEPPQTLSVAAGTFDALRVACRTATPSSHGPSERVWYYAPRIRHYVRREEKFENPASQSHVELVAIQPTGESWPPAARAGLGWALQQALETKTEEQSIEWRSTGVDAEVTIRPTTAMTTGDSPYCRTFEQIVRQAHDQRIYPGKACRSPAGLWLIPGLENTPQAASSD